MFKLEFADACFFVGTAFTIVLVVLDKAGKLKGPLLLALLAVAATMMLPVGIGNAWVMNASTGMLKFGRGLLIVSLVSVGYSMLAIWISTDESLREGSTVAEKPHVSVGDAETSTHSKPSLVFVFGAPLGDNESALWAMVFRHYGPGIAHNCKIILYDDDRKNIEHEWLGKHPNVPFPPLYLAGESQRDLYISEATPESALGNFNWSPVNPNSQHYTITIDCREGYFEEKWEITRVNGVLRSKITIAHGIQWAKSHPDLDPVIFRYEDREFIKTALAVELPKSAIGKTVHPGWKPGSPLRNFSVPVAIIDANGNLQVMTGTKLPDGSTQTDFGSWNILTKHFGD